MIDVSLAIKSAEELDKAVGIVAKLVGKLKANPDLAAQKLSQALGEVAKTLQSVDNAASDFLSLGIDEGALTKNSKLLLDIEGGSLISEVARGRGHCHVIGNIYWTYLDKWFERIFSAEDYAAVKDVFQNLGDADQDLFCDLEHVAVTLQEEAEATLDLVLQNEEANARTRVLSALPILRPLRKTISKTMQTLYSMQGDFIDIAGSL
jgi:hypothetical protein